MISAMGKSGARSSGPTGCSVPGCSGGGSGTGRSAMMLYQALGMRSSPIMILRVPSATRPLAMALYRALGAGFFLRAATLALVRLLAATTFFFACLAAASSRAFFAVAFFFAFLAMTFLPLIHDRFAQ